MFRYSIFFGREKRLFDFMEMLSSDRFDGAAPEPRKGIRSGHVPGSKCIPFAQVLNMVMSLLSLLASKA